MTEAKHRMKRASLERLIAWLKDTDDDHWNMSDVLKVRDDTVTMDMLDHGEDLDRVPVCHTVGCFAGHCILIQAVDKQMMVPYNVFNQDGLIKQAAEFMGIEEHSDYLTLKDLLFTPSLSYYDVTREIAIQALEHIRDKGELHWGRLVKVSHPQFWAEGLGLSRPLPIELY